ncbi:MAG: carbohydrate kinase family protein [Anaerolineae bacterium]|nr:carbohydrate kinase family protein [Anaerolineae bacterium]
MSHYDIYAYGMIAPSTLHILSKPFPAPDGYAEIAETHTMTGGEALNSSIVLSRLGQRVFLDGNWLGDHPNSQALLETLHQYGIDTCRLRTRKRYAGVTEIVFSDEHSRTVFGTYIDLLFTTRQWNIPRKADIARARIVCLDPFFRDESMLAGRYATELGIPYVTIDCSPESGLATGAAATVISGEYRDREYPQTDLRELFKAYQTQAKGLVIFSAGSREILYGRKGEVIKTVAPFPVQTIDTAGAGDAFRAGVVFGLLKGWSDERIIEYAAALAGIICSTFPGVLKCPTHQGVLRFIREQKKTKKQPLT